MALKDIFIGTAGFSYKDWMGNFYPQFCPAADFLRCYAMTFATVELDSTFYRIPNRSTVERWAAVTPDHFRFAAKFPRTVTHEGDLTSRIDEARRFLDAIGLLGPKLGPLLFQLPPGFKPNRIADLVKLLDVPPRGASVAVEFRDRAWLTEEVYALLREKNVGLCLTEYPGMPRPEVRTSDLVYIRFIGDRNRITEDFSYVRLDRAEELEFWTELVDRFAGENRAVYAYFNNHYSGHAPSTAVDFREKLEKRRS